MGKIYGTITDKYGYGKFIFLGVFIGWQKGFIYEKNSIKNHLYSFPASTILRLWKPYGDKLYTRQF